MISIEARLFRRLLAVAILMVGGLWLLQHWWAQSLFLDIEQEKLRQEVDSVSFHIQDNLARDRADLLSFGSKHSGHYYALQKGDQQWLSDTLITQRFPVERWLSSDGLFQFEDGAGRSFIGLSEQLLGGVRVVVIEENTHAVRRLDLGLTQLAALATLTILLVLYLQHRMIRSAFASLNQVRHGIDDLYRGLQPRLDDPEVKEIAPLVQAVNRLLSYLDARATRSRHLVGDLSHAMKTPLAIIRQHVESLDRTLPERERILTQTDELTMIVERELKRARIIGPGSQRQRFSLYRTVRELQQTVTLIHAEKAPEILLKIDQDACFPGDCADFTEMVGNLLDNAAKWCEGVIVVEIVQHHERLVMRIEDNGPGCSPAQCEQLLQRGRRLDEQVSGHGLGMSIVSAIVQQYQGEMTLDRSESWGGLCVMIMLPVGRL